MSSPFWVRITERTADGLASSSEPFHTFGPGPYALVAPHDDDFVLGAGLLASAAAVCGISVQIAVATDGALGYVQPGERAGLPDVRQRELRAACGALGLPDDCLHFLNFPDGSLVLHQGCRGPDEPDTLGQRLVTWLRAMQPSTVFVCTPGDVHPDHRVAALETEIACVWAASRIWLDRGDPCQELRLWHYAVYAPFEGAPEAQLETSEAALERKLAALRCFKSQGVIDPMLSRLAQGGPREYFKRARKLQYRPDEYASLFEA